MRFCAALATLLPTAPRACDLALVLAVDVSGSVDPSEYTTQMKGLALALRDGVVAAALVEQQAQVALVQWSGSSRQEQSLPWTQMNDFADVAAFAQAVDAAPRRWRNFSTAMGEAVQLSVGLFHQVAACKRRVIDVSGDGESNEGIEPAQLRALLDQQSVVVNGLAIETDDADLTAYFYENLIWGEGAFVITANGFADYPAQIKRKLQRETLKQVSMLGLK
jgi:Ca-activated chloride channel family protein